MKKKLLILMSLLTCTIGMRAADIDKALPSDWGGWQNLTYGVSDSTKFTNSLFNSQVEIEGQTIHLLWQENNKDAEGLYRLYYRRSTDLGRTWEQAQQVAALHDRIYNLNQNFMAVSGQLVHIVAIDYQSQMSGNSVSYIRSTDGGATFTTRELATGAQWGGYQRQHIASDGQTVAITYSYATGSNGFTYNDGKDYRCVHLVSSTDGGETFTDQEIAKQSVVDMKVQGNRIVLMGDSVGKLLITTSADGGKTCKSRNIAHVTPNGKSYVSWWTFSYYRPHLAMDGQNINVIYRGSLSDGGEGEPNPGDDLMHTIFQRSTDGGETWQEPMYIEGTCGIEPNIIASKGNYIYVLTCAGTGRDARTGRDAHPTIFYSHDGGTTWAKQRRCFDTYEASIGNFTIVPDDPTGKHVIFTAQQGFYMESKDGFETVYRNFRWGEQAWSSHYRDWNNQSLTVRFDSEGTEHWFMQYSPEAAGVAGYSPYYWNICHRRVERPDAATSNKEMAYHLTRTTQTGIIIPMSPSIMATSEAMTVEAWVRFDAASGSFGFASLNNDKASLGGSQWNYGWFLDLYYQAGGATPGGYAFNGGVRPEQANGTGLFTPWKYLIREMGQWHHVALTYDSNLSQNNVHFYIDGLPYNSRTEHGKIPMGNNPILIGRSDTGTDGDVLIDNFALYSRALTLDEIHQHIYGKPDAKDKDCCLLLTFDGTLRDQSQYHNDPVPLMENPLVEHNGINLPKADFTLTKDTKGTTVYVNDVTPDGEVYWWFKPSATSFGTYNESNKKHESVDYTGHSANYTFWMVAKGDGENTNAFAPVSKDFSISGLSKVYPNEVGQVPGVRLRIQGGYKLNSSNKPRVILKQGTTEIEGVWDLTYGYNSDKVSSFNDLAPAVFNLSTAPVGKYDVIVGTDTLSQAISVEKTEEPEVWMNMSSRFLKLWNRYETYTIYYGNRSNTAAYNVPMFLIIPDRHGQTDVVLNFDFYLCDPGLSEEAQQLAQQLGEYLMAYDEKTQDSIRVYSFMIPYIGPNSTEQLSFRMRTKQGSSQDYDPITIGYWLEDPWGPYDPDAAMTRAAYTLEQGECFAMEWGKVVFETAISFIPGASCLWSIGKAGYSTATGLDGKLSTLFTNAIDVGFNCAEELIPGAHAAQAAWKLASTAYNFYSNYQNIKGMSDCLKGDPKSNMSRGVGSLDPNEMTGPWGPDDNAHYIQPIHQMPYMITFENKSTASAPANEVFVTDTLDLSKLDAETFSFNSFGWADTTLVVGGSQKEFTRDVNYKVNGHDILVRVSGEFNPATGVVNWSFASLEKNGNELADVMNGFLLPNDANGRGEGYVSFTIEHKPNPANGSTISNKATIIFDANKPIVTNTYVNTFDTDYPTSKVTKVEEQDGQLTVTIQGSDKTSGIDHYTIYAQKDGGEWEAAAFVADGSAVSFACEPGTKYGLCAIATDRVGHNEPKDLKAEKEITTSGNAPATATYDLKVAEAGYATFYDSKDHYQLPAGLKASTVSGISGGKLNYQSISGNIVPKGTAVLIEATEKKAATYTLTSTSVADGSPVSTNLLHGSDEATTTSAAGTNLYYKLAYGPSGTSLAKSFGWFWGAQNGAPFSIDGHRAWLAVPSGAAARGYLINGEETTIEGLGIDADANSIWTDLQGRRLTKPTQPGIYFRDGRKVVVK